MLIIFNLKTKQSNSTFFKINNSVNIFTWTKKNKEIPTFKKRNIYFE